MTLGLAIRDLFLKENKPPPITFFRRRIIILTMPYISTKGNGFHGAMKSITLIAKPIQNVFVIRFVMDKDFLKQ